jgi:hypothetical protein
MIGWFKSLYRGHLDRKVRKLLRRLSHLQKIHGRGIREMKKLQAKLALIQRIKV